MSDDPERAGLGKVIYSVDEAQSEETPAEKPVDAVEVTQADEESFPASDPPSFAGGSSTESS